jgi:hypothetical protein
MRHLTITPNGANATDYVKAELGTDGIWFKSPTPLALQNLIPGAISAVCAGADFSFSTFRSFPLGSPKFFTIPAGQGITVRVLLPLGQGHGEAWGILTYHSPDAPPVPSSEKFIPASNVLKRIFNDELFNHERVDRLHNPDRRPREEIWVRHALTAEELSPGAFHLPRWARKLTPEEAAEEQQRQAEQAALNARRSPISGAEYDRLRTQNTAARDAQAAALDEPEAVAPAPAPVAETPSIMELGENVRLKQVNGAKAVREKLKRATRSKVSADRANEASAKAFAAKRVKALERAGKLATEDQIRQMRREDQKRAGGR